MSRDEEICRKAGIRMNDTGDGMLIDVGNDDRRVAGVAVITRGMEKIAAVFAAVMDDHESATFEIKFRGVKKK